LRPRVRKGTKIIQRDIFSSGEYVDHFKPDAGFNPFRVIYDEKRKNILTEVRQRVVRGGAVIDVGGGMGRMSVPLAQDYEVTLCDLSAEMLRLAETAAQDSQVPDGNLSTRHLNAAEPLPFPDDSFDCALSIDLLVHLPDPLATLRELRRILKPSGELFVDMSNSSPWWLLRYPRYVGKRPIRWIQTWRGGGVLPEWQNIVRHYSREHLHAMLSTAEFAIEQEWSYGPTWCPKWYLTRCRRDAE
jgi:ubiquinone/menaquinone biosynthesis C-methylase UbiE